MEMTTSRALAELKLLDKRIRGTIEKGTFAGLAQGKKSITGYETNDEFIKAANSSIQSAQDLIKRRQAIKSAIVNSNAKTEVTIADKKMSVAEAIERKSSIEYEKLLLQKLKTKYFSAKDDLENKNSLVRDKLDELLEAHFGKDSSQKIKSDDIKTIADPYLEQNEWRLIAPKNMEKIITEIEEDINNFELEVDYTLSEINAITKIVIDD
ncbi:MAG: hypothetical protein GY797_27155 [Deltaproteobacteria bacterium]|nr:hypothetical protein [Deltaproteobacteria bacterium]